LSGSWNVSLPAGMLWLLQHSLAAERKVTAVTAIRWHGRCRED
jgi:hypothetical protein